MWVFILSTKYKHCLYVNYPFYLRDFIQVKIFSTAFSLFLQLYMIILRGDLCCSALSCWPTEGQTQGNKRKIHISRNCKNQIWPYFDCLFSSLFWELLTSSVELKQLERLFTFIGVYKMGTYFVKLCIYISHLKDFSISIIRWNSR